MEVWGLTDTGNVREQNQDAYRIEHLGENALLAVVCDGMGGARSGNVASRLASEVFSEEVKRSFSAEQTPQETERMLRSAASLANIAVYEQSQLSEEYSGMGTTLVAALLYEKAALVLNIGESAFNYCSDLTGIVIPSSVTSIGENAFFGCSGLKSVIIPSSVTYLGDYAFSAYFLEDAFFCGNVPDMTPDVFENTNKKRFTIHYTADSTGWTDSDAYDMKLGTWNGYKLALWDGQFVQFQQATPQSVAIHVQNKEEAYVYAAIYENGRFVKTVCKLVPVNAGEVTLTLGLDELPEGAVIKAFVLAADGKTPLAKNAVWTVR